MTSPEDDEKGKEAGNEKEKEERGEFEDYQVTEDELRHTGWEMREPGLDPYQEAYEAAQLEGRQDIEKFTRGEISSQEKDRRLLYHKKKYLLTLIRKMQIYYETTKRHVMFLMSMPSEDKISQKRKQDFIEEMIKLRQGIEAHKKEVESLDEQLGEQS
jgi:hypothetical protein